MTTCYLGEVVNSGTFFIPGGNTPANGGQLFFYVAGSSTKQTVYKDNAASVAWTNPIVLDSGGNLPSGGEVWFPTGQTFKVVFAPSTDTDPPASPYWTKDQLSGINDVGTQTGSEWVSGPAPTYISGTQFVLSGDQSATFTAGRRLKTTNTGGTIYSTIQNATFSAASTTVNVVSDSGSLDSGLSAVSYGIADPANPSVSPYEINRKGAAVASAGNGTTNIWGTIGDYVHVTGTNNIHHFSSAPYAGAMRELVFDGALTLFSSAALTIPGNANLSTAANDVATVRADTVSTHVITNYVHASVIPLVSSFQFAASADVQAASSLTSVVSPGVQQYHPSAAKAWAMAGFSGSVTVSYNMASVTDNGAGDQTYNFTTAFSSANFAVAATAKQTAAFRSCRIGSQGTGSVQVITSDQTPSNQDATASFIACFGGQ